MVRQRRCCDECSRRRKKLSECKPRGPGNKCWSCAKWNRECSFVNNYPPSLEGLVIELSREEKRRQRTLENLQTAERMGIMSKEEADAARENTLKPPPARSKKGSSSSDSDKKKTATRHKIPTLKLEALIEKVASSSAAYQAQHELEQQRQFQYVQPQPHHQQQFGTFHGGSIPQLLMKDHSGSSQDESFTYRPRRSPCHSPSAPPTMMLPPGSPSSLWRLSSDNSLASSQLSSATPTLVNTGITNHPLKMTNQPPGQTNYALAAAAAHAAASSLGTEEPVLTDCHAAAAVLEPQDAAQVALLAWAAASAPPVSLQNGFDTTGAAPEKKEDCSLIMPSPHQMERIPSTETQTKSSAAKSLKRPFSGSTNACEQKTNGAPIPPALSVLAETAGLENTKSVVLRVPGMMCLGSCGATIDRALCVLPETRVVGIDVPRRLVHCHTPVNPYEIVKTLNHVGFDSAIVSIAAKSANLSSGSFTEFCDPPENSFEWDIADTLGLISASCDRRCGGNCSCGPSCMCHWCPVHHPERSKSIRTAANTSPHNSISSFTTTSSGSGSSSFRKPCCSARSSQGSSSAFPQSKTQSNYKPSGAQFQLPPSQPGAVNSRCDDSYFTNSLPPTSIHYSPHCQSNESTSMHQISNAATI